MAVAVHSYAENPPFPPWLRTSPVIADEIACLGGTFSRDGRTFYTLYPGGRRIRWSVNPSAVRREAVEPGNSPLAPVMGEPTPGLE